MMRQVLALLLILCAAGLLLPATRLADSLMDRRAVARAANQWEDVRPRKQTEETKKPEKKDERLAKWERGGILGPPPPEAPPPTLSAVIGDTALLDNREVRVGDTVGAGLKVVEIQANKVVLEKDGQKTELILFPELQPTRATP